MFVLNNDKKLFFTLIVILNTNVNLYSECCTACSSGKNKKNQYVDNNKKNKNPKTNTGDDCENLIYSKKKNSKDVIKVENKIFKKSKASSNKVYNNKKNISDIPKSEKSKKLFDSEKFQLPDEINQLQKDVIILKGRCADLLEQLEEENEDEGENKEFPSDDEIISADINGLKEFEKHFNERMSSLKAKVFQINNEKNILYKDIISLNEDLKKIIDDFYVNKVLKTGLEEQFNKKGITLKKLRQIKENLAYIVRNNIFFICEIHGDVDALAISYDKIKEGFSSKIIYLTMSIFRSVIYKFSYENNYVILKNKENPVDPFRKGKVTLYDYVWGALEDMLLFDDNFYESFCSFIKKIDSNSRFSNLFKYNFFTDCNDENHVCSNIKNKKIKDIILLIKNAGKNSAEKSEFLKANKIILDDKTIKDDEKFLYNIKVEDINEQVYTKAENFNED